METLLAHGRLARPAAGNRCILKAVLLPQARPGSPPRNDTGAASKSRQTARQFRVFLYVVSLLLVGLLVYVGPSSMRDREHCAAEPCLNMRGGCLDEFVTRRERDLSVVLENALRRWRARAPRGLTSFRRLK
jgi:hypothetical protein